VTLLLVVLQVREIVGRLRESRQTLMLCFGVYAHPA
jgi:hypothetical protein